MRIPGGTLTLSAVVRARFKPRRQPAEHAPRAANPHAPARPWPAPFADPPQSIHPHHGMVARYVDQPTSSLNWQGADWETPTALAFKTSTMTARRYQARLTYNNEMPPIHPTVLTHDIAALWRDFRHAVTREDMVVDRGEILGVHIGEDFKRDQATISISVKCWPAIERVTTPRKDTTL